MKDQDTPTNKNDITIPLDEFIKIIGDAYTKGMKAGENL